MSAESDPGRVLFEVLQLQAAIDGLQLLAQSAEGTGALAIKARGAVSVGLEDAARRAAALVAALDPSTGDQS